MAWPGQFSLDFSNARSDFYEYNTHQDTQDAFFYNRPMEFNDRLVMCCSRDLWQAFSDGFELHAMVEFGLHAEPCRPDPDMQRTEQVAIVCF